MAATTIAAAAAKMGGVSGLIQVLQVLKETGVVTGIFGWLGNRGDKKRNAAIVLRYGQREATRAAAIFRNYALSDGEFPSKDAAFLLADSLEDFVNDADKAADAILGDEAGER